MYCKGILIIALFLATLVNAKGKEVHNLNHETHYLCSVNPIQFNFYNEFHRYNSISDGFVCSKRKPKSKLSKIWNKKSPYHGTVYYFPDTIRSSGNKYNMKSK